MKVSQDSKPQSSEAIEPDNQEISITEKLLFMEFDSKIKDYLFDNKIFFRMVNLEEHPFIQLNNHIFRGIYQSCAGTNLFFTDYEKVEQENIFGYASSIKLKHIATQFQNVVLKPVKIPSDMANLPQPLHDIEINKKYDNKTLLKKFAYGTLDLKEDLVIVPRKNPAKLFNCINAPVSVERERQQEGSDENPKAKTSSKNEETQPIMNTETNKHLIAFNKLGATSSALQKSEVIVDILTYKFDKLKKLAMRPTRRKKEPESVAECDEKFKMGYDYNCLKSAIMKPSDYFRTISEEFNERTLVGAVDIDRSILQGVIEPSPLFHRVLTEDEKLALLSIKNLENLSIPMRYIVIKSHLDHLTAIVATLSEGKEFEKNAFGRTIQETIKIYKRLLRVLGGTVTEKYCHSDIEEDNT